MPAPRPIASRRRATILLFASSFFLLSPTLEPQSSRPSETSVLPAPAEIFAAAERAMGSVDALAKIFDFTSLKLNAASEKAFQIPDGPAKLSE